MIKRDLQLYFASLLLTLLFCGWFAAFFLVDSGIARYQGTNAVSAFSVSKSDPTHYHVDLFGQGYELSLTGLNRAESWRKEHACLVTPRKLLNAEIAASLGRYAWIKYYNQYLEEQYLQNISKSPSV